MRSDLRPQYLDDLQAVTQRIDVGRAHSIAEIFLNVDVVASDRDDVRKVLCDELVTNTWLVIGLPIPD